MLSRVLFTYFRFVSSSLFISVPACSRSQGSTGASAISHPVKAELHPAVATLLGPDRDKQPFTLTATTTDNSKSPTDFTEGFWAVGGT